MGKVLEVKNVIKMYPPNKRAVNGVSFNASMGEMIAVCGPSGSGKTTLMRLICGREAPSDGEVSVDFERVGVLLKNPQLMDNLTLLENAMLPLIMRNEDKEKSHRMSIELLCLMGLNRTHIYPKDASLMERCITGLVRAIVAKPALILADEFLGNLNDKQSEKLFAALMAVVSVERSCLILFTNDERTAKRAHRILHLRDGKLI